MDENKKIAPTVFKKWETITAWAVFTIALITYTLTLEPTVSYWDCGEYISTSNKLSVGHPPGAPFFQILGAFFSMLASGPEQIAIMINFMSALASAFTILFMFWTIVILLKKALKQHEQLSVNTVIALLGSATVGCLSYTFSDSFWFSAVEGEVYAMSSFLMALLFYLGLRWEQVMNQPNGDKWLLLLCFIVGLSFGVHLLSLLVIPSIVFLYIYKNYQINTLQKFLIANVAAVSVLIFVFKLLFPFTLKYFSAMELFFVNNVGMPFNSGSFIAGILLTCFFYFSITATQKRRMLRFNTLLLSLLFLMIGFSSWLMLPIRANANTTINENNPSSARELLAYYNREQYGDANIFYDTYYSIAFKREQDGRNPTKDDKPKYEKDYKKGKYVIVNNYKDALPNWISRHKGFMPRMVSTDPSVVQNYKAIAGIPEESTRRPTFFENLKFMASYQFGYMYTRYFMWNFVGRQNDEQGQLGLLNGNWLSGIKFIDELRLGTQDGLPSDLKNNKGRNTYYFLPFILGMIGVYFHYRKDQKNFYTLLLFFLFTGLAIIFYTNPKPFEPRERDYAVVGSFYIFAIWIGMGVMALFEKMKNYGNKRVVVISVTSLCLLVPILMAAKNWDDHDRSNRYTSRMNAKAYLDSCDENAIMFTIGDNDTFPLWYMQEVENYRTDIKLINSSLFQTDWYIDQMKRKTYKAAPIPSQLTHDKYKLGSLEITYYLDDVLPASKKDSILSIDHLMKWIESDNKITFLDLDEDGVPEKMLPTDSVRIPVDKEAVLKSGLVAAKDADKIVDHIDIKFGNTLSKNRIMMLDIIANNDWKQPIYFTGGAHADEEYLWMKDYLQLEGLAYKLVPIKTPSDGNFFEMGRMDTEVMYEKVKNWEWKNITDDNIYLDPESRKNGVSYRNNMERLARKLLEEGDLAKSKEIVDICLEKMPVAKFGHYSMVIPFVEILYQLEDKERARELLGELKSVFQEHVFYYSNFSPSKIELVFDQIERYYLMYDQIVRVASKYDEASFSDKLKEEYVNYLKLFEFALEDEYEE